MSRSDLQAMTLRSLHFEMFEVRLVLSAQSASEIQADSDEPLLLADLHESTGVSHAHNSFGLTGFGQTVAVIDSGIAYDHEALGGGFGAEYRVVGGWDFAENDADPFDDAPAGLHGTLIAGIIGGEHAEHLGVAPNVDLVSLRVFDDQGHSDFDWVESALQWVDDHKGDFEHPITTVNLSLGAKWNGSDLPEWATLEDEFERLRRSGIFVSVAAGNSFEKDHEVGLDYPAGSPHVVPVASHDSDNFVSRFSRRSNRVLVAPGEDITSTATDFIYDFNGITDDYYTASGTSMAAAYVSGASVLVRQAMEAAGRQKITHDSIYGLLRRTADRIYDAETNAYYHHIDVQAALDSLMSSPVNDLGQLASQQITELTASEDGTWYRFTTARSGVLTLELLNSDHRDVSLTVFDTNQQPMDAVTRQPARVDVDVDAGESLFVRLQGDDRQVDVRFTNLVIFDGQEIDVFGTEGADEFDMDLGESLWFSVNGVGYEWSGEPESTIRVHGGAGDDSIRIAATDSDETVWFSEEYVRVESSRVLVEASGTRQNYVHSGTGDDRAYVHDAEFDDACDDLPSYSMLSGVDTNNQLEGFDVIRAFSSPPDDGPLGEELLHNDTLELENQHDALVPSADDAATSIRSTGDDRPSNPASQSIVVAARNRNDGRGVSVIAAAQVARASSGLERLLDAKSDDVYLDDPKHELFRRELLVQDTSGLDLQHLRLTGYGRAEDESASTDDVFTSASLTTLLGVIYHRQLHELDMNNAYVGGESIDQAVFNSSNARDAVYQQATPPVWLEGMDTTAHESGDLAVDHLLEVDDIWL